MATPITPRLRMTRHSPTHDRSAHTVTTFSEAGPSRLPEFSQLVNLTMKDVDISDNNIYASDVPSTPQAPAQVATKTENPAAVLRALLSRLPNKDESPTLHPDTEYQYPSERESDVDTASATASVAQSSLKNIFSRALREPGDTPRKDKSHRRRSSSIGDTDIENTPHGLEALDIKGKRRSLSDDEVDNENKTSARPRTRSRKTPQPLTQEFLRERFGKLSDSPVKHQDAPRDENAALHKTLPPRLDSSQISPPIATSTPQRSLVSFNQSRFNSNLLDKDSEMQNAFDALDSSMDNLSNRSISPIPTLQIDSELVEDTTRAKLDGIITDSRVHTREVRPQTSLQATPRFGNKDLSTGVPSTARSSRSKSTVYDIHESLGEQSMSLSLPMGHILQHDVDLLTNGASRSLSRQHSITSLRPSSPLPDHRRSRTPVDAVQERERNWNKPQSVQHKRSSSHLSHHSPTSSIRSSSPVQVQNRNQGSESPVNAQEREKLWNTHHTPPDSLSPHRLHNHSFSSPRPKSPIHLPESPVDFTHERERNWNAPHPRWHDGLFYASKENLDASVPSDVRLGTNSSQSMSRDSSHVHEHLHTHCTPPKLTRNPPSRPLSPLPSERSSSSLNRTSSLRTDRDTHIRPQSISPPFPSGRPDFSSVSMNGSRRHPSTPAGKEAKVSPTIATPPPNERTNELLESEGEDYCSRDKAVSVTTPYTWPVINSDHRQAQPTPSSNGRIFAHEYEADDVRETDYSSSVDTPKSRPIEPPRISDEQHQAFEKSMVSKALNAFSTTPSTPTLHKNPSAPAVQSTLSSTPPRSATTQSVKLGFKTPSPPKMLPDLPTPSSSDESNDGPLTKMAKISKLGTAHQNKWLQTPKPPGGWLVTPQLAKTAESTVLDEPETPGPNDKEDSIPETPVASETSKFATKTPKPPGSWATPAPRSLKFDESNYPEDDDQRSQLLTPVNSLSRGSALNSKTPGVPGGWANTPAARKSVMKVRFDPQSSQVKEELRVQDSAPESRGEDSNSSELDNPSQGARNLTLPSPRSPRRHRASIRVLDAFGREDTPSSSPKKDSKASRNGIRVLDAMGRDIEEEQSEDLDKMEETTTPLTRDVLLSRLRQGLNELVEDIGVVDTKEDVFTGDRSRIEELVATSKQARGIREKLSSQSKKIAFQPSYVPFSWRMWFGLILAQVLLIFLAYRTSVIYSRNFFLNAYYDPFNPELHLFKPDGIIHVSWLHPSSVWPRAMLHDRSAWFTWFESTIDIAAYLSALLPMDQNNAWTPT